MLLIPYGRILPDWIRVLISDANYSHGLLIPFISLYLVHQRREELGRAAKKPCNTGLLYLTGGLALLVAGSVAGEFFTQRFSLIPVIYGLILFLEGRETAAILRLPVFLLVFSLPLPYILYDAVAFPLKIIATKIAVFFLTLYGMPVFREGNIVHLPHMVLEVVDACSGIRSLMTLVTLAFLLATFMHREILPRLLLVLAALPIAVMANAIRVAVNGILTSYSMIWARGFLHEFTGWFIFLLSFACLWGISSLLTGIFRKSAGN